MIDFDSTYDSHVHFFGVGLPAVQWRISKEEKITALPPHLENSKCIKGFGLYEEQLADLRDLSLKHPEKHFFISFQDGHRSFFSKAFIKSLGIQPSLDSTYSEVQRDKISKNFPKETSKDLTKMALYAENYFLRKSIKKLRHLTCTQVQWDCLTNLSLKVQLDCFFSEFLNQSFEEAVDAFKMAKAKKNLFPKGIKVFFDGSFGSKTALSKAHPDVLPRQSEEELQKKLHYILIELKAEAAIHCIGEMALEKVLRILDDLQQQSSEELPVCHLEHVPIFTEASLKILKNKKLNCQFHFQPSHWISDQLWYKENKNKLDPHEIYPFQKLKGLNYEFYFGSDAPVVDSSEDLTLKGLRLIESTKSTSKL